MWSRIQESDFTLSQELQCSAGLREHTCVQLHGNCQFYCTLGCSEAGVICRVHPSSQTALFVNLRGTQLH